MKELIIKYRSVIKFIVTFLLFYGLLTFFYNMYLDFSDGASYYPDYFTNAVAKQTEALIQILGYDTQIIRHPDEPTLKLMINGKYVARVIEGCNSISVIILFISFIIAFAGPFKTTFSYIIVGSVLIYIVNLLRIVILSIGLYHYPSRSDELHSIIFPLIIYSMVFLLWMFWINKFSYLRTPDE